MPRINGWERVKNAENSLGRTTVWRHEKEGLRLAVFQRGERWIVQLPEMEIEETEDEAEEMFRRKKEAMSFARDYMKENPFPEEEYGKFDDVMFSLMIPAEYNNGEEIEDEEIRGIIDRMIERFGGVTIDAVQGGWQDSQGQTVYDNNLQVMALRKGEDGVPIGEDQFWLQELADEVAERFGQSEVMMLEDPVEADFIHNNDFQGFDGNADTEFDLNPLDNVDNFRRR